MWTAPPGAVLALLAQELAAFRVASTGAWVLIGLKLGRRWVAPGVVSLCGSAQLWF